MSQPYAEQPNTNPPYANQAYGNQPQAPARPHVGMGQAIKNWGKYMFHFSGRASRSEFWWVILLWFILFAVVAAVFSIMLFSVREQSAQLYAEYTAGAMSYDAYNDAAMANLSGIFVLMGLIGLLSLAQLVTTLGLHWRRLHDAGFSGLFFLFSLVGLGIVPLIMAIMPSNPEGARYDEPIDANRP